MDRSCLKPIGCLLAGGITAFLLLAMCAIVLQVFLITTPWRNGEIGHCADLVCEDVTLATSDGLQISAWYVPGWRDEGIVLVHGIHANRTFLMPEATLLAEAGYHLLMIDLRGHGRSQGNELTYGYREARDVQAGVDYLLTVPEVNKVGALGHSLGGAAVAQAAANDERLQAIVVQSSYSRLSQVVEERFDHYALLPKWPFAPLIVGLAELRLGLEIERIDSIRALTTMSPRPVLIVHSTDDNLFRPDHAQMLYDAAPEPKSLLLVEGVGHINPIFGDEAAYKMQVLEFFNKTFFDNTNCTAADSPAALDADTYCR